MKRFAEFEQGNQGLAALFLGPKGENTPQVQKLMKTIVKDHYEWRQSYMPQDPEYITQGVKNSLEYQEYATRLQQGIVSSLQFGNGN